MIKKEYIVKLSIEDSNGEVQYEVKMTKQFLDDLKLREIFPLDGIYQHLRDLIKAQDIIFKDGK